MVEELDNISNERRRNKLISHALRIRQLHTPQIDIHHIEQFINDYQEEINRLSLVVGVKDRLLICEAIKLNCDYFLTTDHRLTLLRDISVIREIEINLSDTNFIIHQQKHLNIVYLLQHTIFLLQD